VNSPEINALFARLDQVKESFAEQPAPDFTSYRERVGLYNGLKEAINIVQSLYDKDEDDF